MLRPRIAGTSAAHSKEVQACDHVAIYVFETHLAVASGCMQQHNWLKNCGMLCVRNSMGVQESASQSREEFENSHSTGDVLKIVWTETASTW